MNKNDYFNFANAFVSFCYSFYSLKGNKKQKFIFKNHFKKTLDNYLPILYSLMVLSLFERDFVTKTGTIIVCSIFLFFTLYSSIIHFLRFKNVFLWISRNKKFLKEELQIQIPTIKKFLFFKMILIFPSIFFMRW